MYPLIDPTSSTAHLAEDPQLNFDDLLDMAREFEFTRTITHVWPCEEESSTCPDTGLEDILAAIMSTSNTEESPLPLPSSILSMVHAQDSAPMCPEFDTDPGISRDAILLSMNDRQARVEVEPPIASILGGWSPPDGSQFLDLDDSLMLPQPQKDVWIPPWLAAIFASPCTQPASNTSPSSSPAMAPATGDVQPQRMGTDPGIPLVDTTDQTSDDPKKNMIFESLPVQPSTCAIPILEPVRARSALQTTSNVPSQTVINPHAKTSKSCSQPSPTPATGYASTATHVRAPRGGVPPHIARTVTKANILRVEKERKVMQNTISSTTTGERKKPSVLRRAAKVERETTKIVHGGNNGKKQFAWVENSEKDPREAKRARI